MKRLLFFVCCIAFPIFGQEDNTKTEEIIAVAFTIPGKLGEQAGVKFFESTIADFERTYLDNFATLHEFSKLEGIEINGIMTDKQAVALAATIRSANFPLKRIVHHMPVYSSSNPPKTLSGEGFLALIKACRENPKIAPQFEYFIMFWTGLVDEEGVEVLDLIDGDAFPMLKTIDFDDSQVNNKGLTFERALRLAPRSQELLIDFTASFADDEQIREILEKPLPEGWTSKESTECHHHILFENKEKKLTLAIDKPMRKN